MKVSETLRRDGRFYLPDGRMKALAIPCVPIEPGGRRPLEVIGVEEPTPQDLGPGEVLVETIRTMMCGTDQDMLTNPGHGAPTEGCVIDGVPHIRNGHESGGRVIALSDDVEGLGLGDIVTEAVRKPGGCPACQAGKQDNCYRWRSDPPDMGEWGIFRLPGGFCPRVIRPASSLVRMPSEFTEEERMRWCAMGDLAGFPGKALLEALIVGARYPGYLRSDDLGREPAALVLGAGAAGLQALHVLRSEGLEHVVVAARTPYDEKSPHLKAQLVEELGGRYVSVKQRSVSSFRELAPMGQFDVIVDACGHSPTIMEAMVELNDTRTVFVLTSITGGDAEVSFPADKFIWASVLNNLTVIGVVNANSEHIRRGLDGLVWAHKTSPGWPDRLLTHSFDTLEALAEGFEGVSKESGYIRAYVDFR